MLQILDPISRLPVSDTEMADNMNLSITNLDYRKITEPKAAPPLIPFRAFIS